MSFASSASPRKIFPTISYERNDTFPIGICRGDSHATGGFLCANEDEDELESLADVLAGEGISYLLRHVTIRI